MRVIFRITAELLDRLRKDLQRVHPFAAERVGFISCQCASLDGTGVLILAGAYHSVEDADYIEDRTVGARIGSEALRKALQFSYHSHKSMFHVHLHEHLGRPRFSRTDTRETADFVPDFWNVQPGLPHGAIVFSHDSAVGSCWLPGSNMPVEVQEFNIVGSPMRIVSPIYD